MQGASGGDQSVFVLGCPRSGTSLLYSIITSSEVFPTYEAESRIMECSTRYGSLSRADDRDEFLRDFLRSRQYSRSGLTDEQVRSLACTAGSYLEFLRLFMEAIASNQGKRRWVEKTPNHILFAESLGRAFPRAQFIHVLRDGRDVALSQRRLGWTDQYSRDPLLRLVWAGKIWERLTSQSALRRLSAEGRLIEIRYEELVTRTDECLARLGSFLDISLCEEVLRTSEVGVLKKSNSAFQPHESGLCTAAMERWKRRLERDEARVLTWAIAGGLKQHGYKVDRSRLNGPIPIRVRLTAATAPVLLATKHFLNRHTPVGRSARKPLEIGLS